MCVDRVTLKEFHAISPFGKHLVVRCYSRATAFNARRFLCDVIDQMPYPVHSIQVDGGSEFMAEFENECEKLGIRLFVLPPRRPQYNGAVERSNATLRTEF